LPKGGHKKELKFIDPWIMTCIVDGKPFDLAYMILKHMSNVIK
jgi:hypothetical protein